MLSLPFCMCQLRGFWPTCMHKFASHSVCFKCHFNLKCSFACYMGKCEESLGTRLVVGGESLRTRLIVCGRRVWKFGNSSVTTWGSVNEILSKSCVEISILLRQKLSLYKVTCCGKHMLIIRVSKGTKEFPWLTNGNGTIISVSDRWGFFKLRLFF